ncbi:MAG: type III-B CRISPR module-associated Cmr3 family protein [bacterium]|nr:type III-B CRISPR module-associated Cmr3 family protein [bacterium]
MKLFLQPVDVWLFRDGRPFNRGTDHRARCVFPPAPSVLQGALRSHHIALCGGITAYLEGQSPAVEMAVGKPGENPPPSFRLRGPWLARRNSGGVDRYFPLPADAVRIAGEYQRLHPATCEGILTDLQGLSLLWPPESVVPRKVGEEPVWVSEQTLSCYLGGSAIPAEEVVRQSEFFVLESRVGIGRDPDTRAARQGDLFEVEFVRPVEGCGLLVEVQGLSGWPEEGIMAIGGESRGARYLRLDDIPGEATVPGGDRLRAFFTTPGLFSGGWQPAGGNWGAFFDGPVNLVATALGRPLVLGGYDLARRRHKPSYRHVPAGSVYFFEGPGRPRGVQLTEEYVALGYGECIWGVW